MSDLNVSTLYNYIVTFAACLEKHIMFLALRYRTEQKNNDALKAHMCIFTCLNKYI